MSSDVNTVRLATDPSTIVTTYVEQLDRFRKLSRIVGEQCRNILAANRIPCTVSWRAKAPESLARKLEIPKFWQRIQDGQEFYRAVGDLAAVRVCTYRDSDRPNAVSLICQSFAVDKVVVLDDARKNEEGPRRWYSATHLQAELDPAGLAVDDRNLVGLTCEIQVCSLLSHAWNEVEHDVNYKPRIAAPETVRALLCELGECKARGDVLVEQILELSEAHLDNCRALRLDRFSDFKQAIEAAPLTVALKVDGDSVWRQLHAALIKAGVETAGELWSGIRDFGRAATSQLMDSLNEENIAVMRIAGGHGIDAMSEGDTFLFEPNVHSHRALLALLPTWADAFLMSDSEIMRSMSAQYCRLREAGEL